MMDISNLWFSNVAIKSKPMNEAPLHSRNTLLVAESSHSINQLPHSRQKNNVSHGAIKCARFTTHSSFQTLKYHKNECPPCKK